MSTKRLLVISIFMALVAVILSHGREIRAETADDPPLEPEYWHFTHITNEPLNVAASGAAGCQAVAEDTANYSFALPVTAALRDDLVSALAGGGTSAVAFQTETIFLIEGNGSADYTAEFDLIVFDDSSGAETILKSWQVERPATESGPVTELYTYLFTEDALSQLQVGDILRVSGTAQAIARSGGCQSTDRAAVATKPIDNATPILYVSFTNCDSLGLAGTPYVPGVNCRLVPVDEFPRAYIVYVPETVEDPAAVVFMFHGSSGNGGQYFNISGWTEKADDEGFYAVYPTGLKYCNRPETSPETCKWSTKWNSYKLPEEEGFDFSVRTAGYPETAPFPADDVGFTQAMIDDLSEPANGLRVDPERIYASGFSNGAAFAGRLAVDMADQFAAVAYTSGGLVSVDYPVNLPLPPVAHIPVYAAFGAYDDRIMRGAGWDPADGELPLEPSALLALCGLVDYYIRPHLDGLEHVYDPSTFVPYLTIENQHSTLFRWQSSSPEHLFLLGVLEGVQHTYPKGYDVEKNPYGFVAADEFWNFFLDPESAFDAAQATQASAAMTPACPAGPTTGDYGDAADDTNTPLISPNTAYIDTGVSGAFPTTWPGTPAGPVHFDPQVWLGDEVSLEDAADAGPDPDGANNIVDGPADNADNDAFDDGWLNQDALFPHCERTTLKVRITRATTAVEIGDMFLNVWFDGNRDGDWEDHVVCPSATSFIRAGEWIVRNQTINSAIIPLGGSVDLDVLTNRIPNQDEDKSHWLRFTLSERPVPVVNNEMPDGRGPQGGHEHGETEDYAYEPPLPGAPGDLVITQEIAPNGPVAAGDLLDVTIDLEHVGGDGPAVSQITDFLPDGLSYVGPIKVESVGPGVSPLLATYDKEQEFIFWEGRVAPDSKLLVSFPVRVGACFGGGTRPVSNVVSSEWTGGSPITAEATLDVACSPAGIDDISVERKLFFGDEEVTAGDNGLHVILDGSDDSVTLKTSVTNNGDRPVLLGLVDVVDYKQGGENATSWPVLEPEMEKVERVIILPIFGGETRNFTEDDVLGRLDMSGATAIGLEPLIANELTYCLIEFNQQSCPDPVANPGLAAEDGPINILLARRDLGDSPDSSNNFGQPMTAYPAVPGDFPTVRNPATGLPPGPVHITPRPFHLGRRVSLEVEADIGPDQDPTNNILPLPNVANRDRADDGIQPSLLSFNHCQPATFQARIFISPAAVAYFANQDADGLAHLNVWLDGNGNGHWRDAVDCPPEAPEHIVIDQAIDPVALGPGLQTINVTTGPVPWAGVDCAWLRITLSDRPSEKPLTFGNVSHGDGRGDDTPYISGETEDHLICPGGPGEPELDMQVVGRPVFVDEAAGSPLAGDPLMEQVYRFELLATIANVGSAVAEDATLDIDLSNGGGEVQIDRIILATDSNDDFDFIDLTGTVSIGSVGPGDIHTVLVRASSSPGSSNPIPPLTAQFNVAYPLDNILVKIADTLKFDHGPALFAPTITSALTQNEVIEGLFAVNVTGTAEPGGSVEVTLERLNPAGQISGETTAGGDGLWSITFDDVPQGNYRTYAVTTSGDEHSPRSNEYPLAVGGQLASFFRLTDEAGRQRVFNLSDNPFVKLRPGETYQIEVPMGSAEPGLQVFMYLPEIGDEVFLLDEDGDGIYEGQFTVPADQSAQANKTLQVMTFSLALVGDDSEVIHNGQMVIDDAQGRAFDSGTGQPLAGADVTALALRSGTMASSTAALLQPWSGVPFNHPNPVFAGDDGAYRFLVPKGDYHLRASQPGYQPYLSPRIACHSLCGGVLGEPLGLTRVFTEPAEAVLTMNRGGFYPAVVTIESGDIVEWLNMDLSEHSAAHKAPAASSIQTTTGGDWSSGLLEPGGSYKRRFTAAGIYTIVDETNPANSATIIVEGATLYLSMIMK